MRKIGGIIKYVAYGVALYTLFSMAAQSGLYALCYNNLPNVSEGFLENAMQWLMSIEATTCRTMMVVIVLSIIEARSRILHLIAGIICGWAAMTLWNLLFTFDVAIAWRQIASSWFVAILATSIAAMPWHRRVRRTRVEQPKKSDATNRRTQRPAQKSKPREEEHREETEQVNKTTNQETQRIVKITDAPRRRRRQPEEKPWEEAAEEAGLYRYRGQY